MIAGIVVAVLALPVLVGSGYQLTLALAAFAHRPFRGGDERPRVTVLVPAHDEEKLIGRTVGSLLAQDYPRERYEVVVIADNCSDATAAQAEAAGARVLVREVPDVRGKGQALRWAFDRLLAEPDPPGALAVVDADTFATPSFLSALVAPLAHGARVVQGESLLEDDGTNASALRAAAFLLVNRVRPSGRAALGLPSHLAGNGMLFRRDVLEEVPWEAFTSAEDLEYGIRLRLHGIPVRFARGAILLSPTAPTRAAAEQQQLRWEGGKVHLARRWAPRLLRAGKLDAAVDLAVPPLGLLFAAAFAGTAVAALLALVDVAPWWAVLPWAAALAAIPVYVVAGLAAARAPRSAYVALVGAPLLVARKLPRLARLARFRGDTWVRTDR